MSKKFVKLISNKNKLKKTNIFWTLIIIITILDVMSNTFLKLTRKSNHHYLFLVFGLMLYTFSGGGLFILLHYDANLLISYISSIIGIIATMGISILYFKDIYTIRQITGILIALLSIYFLS